MGGAEYFDTFRSFLSHVMVNEIGRDVNREASIGSLESSEVGSMSESVEVTMGQEGLTSNMEKNAIPIMPKTFVNIAKEASKISKETIASDKKKI